MTRSTMETMIDRYLDGGLSASERQAFEQQLASNSEFARTVRAERVIRETLSKDREAARINSAPLRAHLLAMLGTVPGAGIGISAAGSATGIGSGFGAAKLASLAVGALGIVAGSVFMTIDRDGPLRVESRASENASGNIESTRPPVAQPAFIEDLSPADGNVKSELPAPIAPPVREADPSGSALTEKESSSATGSAVMSSDTVRTKVTLNLNRLKKSDQE